MKRIFNQKNTFVFGFMFICFILLTPNKVFATIYPKPTLSCTPTEETTGSVTCTITVGVNGAGEADSYTFYSVSSNNGGGWTISDDGRTITKVFTKNTTGAMDHVEFYVTPKIVKTWYGFVDYTETVCQPGIFGNRTCDDSMDVGVNNILDESLLEQKAKDEACSNLNNIKGDVDTNLSAFNTAYDNIMNCNAGSCTPEQMIQYTSDFTNADATLTSSIQGVSAQVGNSCDAWNNYLADIKSDEKRQNFNNHTAEFNDTVQNDSSVSDETKKQLASALYDAIATMSRTNYSSSFGAPADIDCSTYSEILDIVSEIFGWIQIIAPVLLIVFGALDFTKATLSNDQDMLKKATSNFVKRALCAIGIFFLPMLINLLFSMDGVKDIAGSSTRCEIVIK